MNNRTISNTIAPILIALTLGGISARANAAPGQVLILDSTVTGGDASPEAQRILELGFTPVLIDQATWASMSTADFSDYEAIVLGDPTCGANTSVFAAAEENAATWAAAIDGNVMVMGTDPTWHITYGPFAGAQALTDGALGFVLADAGTGSTGAYVSLSCYYHFSAPSPIAVLDGFGSFSLQGAQITGALNDVHIVAEHPALIGITDPLLSNWSNSVHENFLSWPNEFEVLALALNDAGTFVAGDGSVGFPYLLARGVIPDLCGNGALDPAENCDDGNNVEGDGCDAACNFESIEAELVPLGDECPDDADCDGVPNNDDQCDNTILPESVPIVKLGINRFADIDGNGVFDTRAPNGHEPQFSFTLQQTGGCSCEQIIEELGLGQGHEKFGCSHGVMQQWVASLAEAFTSGGTPPGGLQSPNTSPDAIPDPVLDTTQIGGCRMGDQPGNAPAWALLGLMFAVVGRRRRS